MSSDRCGWHGTLSEFIVAAKQSILSDLYARYPAATLQEAAWHSTLDILQEFLRDFLDEQPAASDWEIIFEYQMPRARDRPLDVCILGANCVVVIEVKDSDSASTAAVDQLRGYLRDLREYHEQSRARRVSGMVLVTRTQSSKRVHDTLVGNVDSLSEALESCEASAIATDEAQAWMDSRFEPLPSLVEAALRIYEEEPLPQIRTVKLAEIKKTTDYILENAKSSRDLGENHLILLTGVPGSGKTLVGLQVVYQYTGERGGNARGLYLSGCGPLIEVLQYQLRSQVFVQNIHSFVTEYVGEDQVPEEDLYVFDEAQRAWDMDYVVEVNRRKKRDLPPKSEPEMLLDILGKREGGSCLVAVLGEGQSIYKGEQGGIALWTDAVDAVSSHWRVHLPPHAQDKVSAVGATTDEGLHLSETVRAHRATRLADWVGAVLDARVERAALLADELSKAGYWMRIARDIDQAKNHLREVYGKETQKTYGMVGSSKARDLRDYGVDLTYVGAHWLRPGQVGPWYVDRDDRPAECRQLVKAAQEFQCQGLELDGALVLWGRDLSRQDGAWVSRAKKVKGIRDPHEIRLNAYRVLLSRARDGFIVFLPPTDELEETYRYLLDCGLKPVDEASNDPPPFA